MNVYNPDYDIQHSPVFASVRIITKKVEVSINKSEFLCGWIHDEYVRGVKLELGK